MTFWRWGGVLLQRLLLFLFAGLLVVLLLHVQTGLKPAPKPGGSVAWVAKNWTTATQKYLTDLVHGNLGTLKAFKIAKYTADQPVATVVRQQAPASLYLLGVALVLSLLVGSLLGLAASRFGWGGFRGATLSGTLLLLSTPDILLVFLLRKLVIWVLATYNVQLFRTGVFGGLQATDVIGPAIALSALPVALVARTATVAFDEVYETLYIRTARGKGLHPLRVVFKHAVKNAWLRVAESGSLIAGTLVTGLVVVEYSFYYPGLGRTLGLILERGGQPAASSGIALALLVGAALLDLVFESVRLWLDPRLRERRRETHDVGGFGAGGSLWNTLRDLPEALVRAIWSWRPSRVLKELITNPPLFIGTIGVLALVFLAVFGGQLADLRTVGNMPKYIPFDGKVYFPPFKPGLPGFPLGSDVGGRDILSRILVGARYTILFTLAVTPVRMLFAVPWGLMAGFRRGLWAGASRATGLLFAALPMILVPAALLPLRDLAGSSAQSTASFWVIVAVLAVVGVPRLVDSIRLQVESTLVQPFVEGARAAGAGAGRILGRHILPHLMPQLWISAAADMAWTLLMLAQLGVFGIYLGGLVQLQEGPAIPRLADWSSMLARPYDVFYKAPWSIWIPAGAFLLAIISFNLTAEGLRRRAQRLASAPAVPEPVTGPDGKERIPARAIRRLSVDWAFGLAVLALVGIYTGKYGFKEQPSTAAAAQKQAEKPPLERARDELQVALDTLYGTGDNLDKARVAARLDQVVLSYLGLSEDVKLSGQQVQTDTRGRALVFDQGDGVRLVQVQVPDQAMGSHIYLRSPNGFWTTFIEYIKPAYVGVGRQGEALFLTAAGTVPGPDNWGVKVWRLVGQKFEPSPEGMSALFDKIPAEFKAKMNHKFGDVPHSIEMTTGPLASIRVDPKANVSVCQTEKGPCVDIPFSETGY